VCFGVKELVPNGPELYVAPTVVDGFHKVTDISLSSAHACLIDSGQVFCWGDGAFGRTGNEGSSRTPRLVPLPDAGEAPAVSVGLGTTHSCALAGGDVYCWGGNAHGQLGSLTAAGGMSPVAATAFGDVVQLSVGSAHACVLRAGGDVYCFGQATHGELGADTGGDPTMHLYPISGDQVVATAGLTYVRSGETWFGSGFAGWGQLGDALPPGPVFTPSEVAYLDGSSALSIDQTHCYVGADALVRCGGLNDGGALGDGSNGPPNKNLSDITHTTLGPVKSLAGFSEVKAAFCTITEADTVFCWGAGALHGGPSPVLVPTEVPMP